jgi:hypothetical protein
MEAQANEFAALMLMPPPLLRKVMGGFGDPNLSQAIDLAKQFDVSKEAAARAFAQYNDEPVAVIVTRGARIDRIYRNAIRFPRMSVQPGDAVPKQSLLHDAVRAGIDSSEPVTAAAEAWLESSWGKRLPDLCEQVHLQREGFALIMLWAEVADDEEDDGEDDRTSKQRLQDRLTRSNQ